MVRFAHIADVHLGGWKQPEMQQLNFQSFKKAVDICLSSKLDFILIAGDLFDSAYPPIEILKQTFEQFKRIKEARIPVFLIAGSHDYSVSGRTFLDVLEKAGFCKNVFNAENSERENDETIYLNPEIYGNIAIYGYHGKKSGLEVPELRKVKLNDSPGMFKIFMLHSTIDKVVGNVPMDYLNTSELPKADYYAMGHIHVRHRGGGIVYPGPVFPNSFKEMEDLEYGSFVIVDTDANEQIQHIKIPTRPIEKAEFEITDAYSATEHIISELEKRNLEDKVILLRIKGELEKGKNSDIKFSKIEDFVRSKGAYFMLKNTHDLKSKELEMDMDVSEKSSENIEDETINNYAEKNPSEFNNKIPQLMSALSLEKQEDEKNETFNSRLIDEVRRILEF